jgi:RNA polymerase sigma factor (TIGR02999 family)
MNEPDAPSLESSELQRTADELVPLLYPDLRRLARQSRWRVSAGGTMQTTALVHEAYIRLRASAGFNDRQHFLRAAAIAMRQILVNMARDAVAEKRGGGDIEMSALDTDALPTPMTPAGVLEVHEALDRLRVISTRLAQVVECRFFGGYTDEETAIALGLTDRSVRRDWVKARAWLGRELDPTTRFDIEGSVSAEPENS